jgi:very-short-patch-repair endonuclease
LIYIDGPHHRGAAIKMVDDAKRQALRDAGYRVITFTEERTGWPATFARFSFVFGKGVA